ncbi:MAG: hypothetical protein AAF108_06420 [Planctomycetota bacterium]
MLQINDGQCGKCAHFGEDHPEKPELVQVRVKGQAPEDLVESCGHPSHEPLGLKVSAHSGCSGFQPVAA